MKKDVGVIAVIQEMKGKDEETFKILLQCMDLSLCYFKSTNEVFAFLRLFG